jgi:cytochrome P450
MKTLLDHPDAYSRCAGDFDFCTKVIEEAMRLNSPATITRRVGQDVVYRDVLLPKGILLFFPVNVSGRDPESFENADEFQPERERGNRHLAFGRGMHICLGQFIARAQIEEGLHLIAQRMRNPRLMGPVGHRTFFGVWGLRGLPIEFDPRTA